MVENLLPNVCQIIIQTRIIICIYKKKKRRRRLRTLPYPLLFYLPSTIFPPSPPPILFLFFVQPPRSIRSTIPKRLSENVRLNTLNLCVPGVLDPLKHGALVHPCNIRFSTYFQVPVHNSIVVAVVYAFQDLLDTVRRVRFAVEFSRHDILEQFAAGHAANREYFRD